MLVARSITRPLNNVGATMAQVAQRQFEVEIPATNRGDEIGSIAKALASFRDDLAKAELLAEEQRKAVEERAAMEAEQARVVEKLSGSLSMLAEGDLTMRIDQAFAPEYETLRGNFNDAITRLEEAISTVVVTVDSIRNDSIQVSQAADELSHRTENQAAALEESAASLEELTSSVKAAASTAEQRQQGRRRGPQERRGERPHRPRRGRGDERDREVVQAHLADHRRDRRHRLPDQPLGAERRRRGGARR